MRKLLFLILASLALGAAAQTGLNINRLYNHPAPYGTEAVETKITWDEDESDNGVMLVRVMSIRPDAEQAAAIEGLVKKDGRTAETRETRYRDAQLNYAFYSLKPRLGLGRYIYYLNQRPAGGKKAIVLYIEAYATAEKIKQLIKLKQIP